MISVAMLLAAGIYIQLTQKYQTVNSTLAILIPALGLSMYTIGDNLNWIYFTGLLGMNLVTMIFKL